jgi:hypothetical protein
MSRGLRGNWGAFWTAALRDHCQPGLIWNQQTRSELREALQVTPSTNSWLSWASSSYPRSEKGMGGWHS